MLCDIYRLYLSDVFSFCTFTGQRSADICFAHACVVILNVQSAYECSELVMSVFITWGWRCCFHEFCTQKQKKRLKNKHPLISERLWGAVIIDNVFYIIVSRMVNEREPLTGEALGITVTADVLLSGLCWEKLWDSERDSKTAVVTVLWPKISYDHFLTVSFQCRDASSEVALRCIYSLFNAGH